MKAKKLIVRLIHFPLGVIKGLLKIANDGARDVQNKSRFSNALIENGCSFSDDAKVGTNSHILQGAVINHSQIGCYTYLSKNALVQHATIGNYCSVSHDVNIGLGAHPLELFSTSPIFYRKRNPLKMELVETDYPFSEYKQIEIGSDVWIGAKVIVLDGVRVGHGAVLATGAIVTKDVPPYAVVGGVPAKIIKYRFSEKICNSLLKTEWWKGSAEEVLTKKDELTKICNGQFSNSII